ncbi:uncharacterized protein LOC129724962 [Wyeomyia smithii]|uniref:uncharacterized protein LOC129724962 n=1 Tax=Wyeomyia smithii TaxID=174621 RepID=UPI002467F0D5|nr:uncharacterized protein LOC129724962 [Wyeomyia smithii]
MFAVIRNPSSCEVLRFITVRIEHEALRHYASANRVKPFKKVDISNKARNEAKALQMRMEVAAQEEAITSGKSVDAVGQSLASRGYLRPVKPYSPPDDVQVKVLELAKALNKTNLKEKFSNVEEKFTFLSACQRAFKHAVPNSQLHEITSIDDTVAFYQKPVDTTLPLEALKTVDLPENLFIQHEYIRFHPETDTMFGGKSAFPKSSTVVTGLKYKDKYRGHAAKKCWP